MVQIKRKLMALNENWNLKWQRVTVEGVAVSHHDSQSWCWSWWQSKELGHARLNDVMHAAAVHENDHLVVAQRPKEAEGLQLWGTLHSIQADL